MPLAILVASCSFTPTPVPETFDGAAWKHRISCTFLLPPVEPVKPNLKLAGSAPLATVMSCLVITG